MKKVVKTEKNTVPLDGVDYQKTYIAKAKGSGRTDQVLLIVIDAKKDEYRLVSLESNLLFKMCLIKDTFETVEEAVKWVMENGYDIYEFDSLLDAVSNLVKLVEKC